MEKQAKRSDWKISEADELKQAKRHGLLQLLMDCYKRLYVIQHLNPEIRF
jgi:hypothetical protein